MKYSLIFLLFTIECKSQITHFITDTTAYGIMIGDTKEVKRVEFKTTLFEFDILNDNIKIISNNKTKEYKIISINDGRQDKNPEILKFDFYDTFLQKNAHLYLHRVDKNFILMHDNDANVIIYRHFKSI